VINEKVFSGVKPVPPKRVVQLEVKQKKLTESEVKARCKFLESGFGKRLQSENPFDEFRLAVEKAVIERNIKEGKSQFEGDQDFYKDGDDIGMCMSMHQPWASLLVHGFKRFEGREWTHKYRGPLWI